MSLKIGILWTKMKIFTRFPPLSSRKMYKDQLKLKKVEETKLEFMKNNGEHMKPSDNKINQMCGIIGGKLLAITNRFKGFNNKKP